LLRKIALALAAWGITAAAGEIRFGDYKFLELGMDEAEVLLRVGPPDREQVIENVFGAKGGEKWSYVPDGPNGWLTILWFDAFGRVIHIQRDRP
jgi:hypothetical protein